MLAPRIVCVLTIFAVFISTEQIKAKTFLGVALIQSDEINGAQVAKVLDNSPASQAGLKRDDVIVAVGDAAIDGPQTLINDIAARKPGDKVTIKVMRDQVEKQIEVTLGEFPKPPSPDNKNVQTKTMKLSDIQKEYKRLLPLWQKEREQFSPSSNTADYWDGPHGKSIIALGPAIIPELIAELRKGDFFFNVPLARITKVKIATSVSMSEQEKSQLWLKWWEGVNGTQDRK